MKQHATIFVLLLIVWACLSEPTIAERDDLVSLALSNPVGARTYLQSTNSFPLKQFPNARLMVLRNGEFVLEGPGYLYKAIPLIESFPHQSFPPATVEGYMVNDRVVLINSIPKIKREAPGVSMHVPTFANQF